MTDDASSADVPLRARLWWRPMAGWWPFRDRFGALRRAVKGTCVSVAAMAGPGVAVLGVSR